MWYSLDNKKNSVTERRKHHDNVKYRISVLDGKIDALGTKMYDIVKTFKVEDNGESEKPRYYAVKAQRDKLIKRRSALIWKIAR